MASYHYIPCCHVISRSTAVASLPTTGHLRTAEPILNDGTAPRADSLPNLLDIYMIKHA